MSLLFVSAALVLLAAPAASSAAAPAQPLGPIVKAKASAMVSGAPGTIGKATAKCPAGTSVVSGGVRTFALIELEGDAQVLIPYISRRSGPRAWTVAVYSVGQIVDPKRFTAIAYCRKGLGRVLVKSRRGAVAIGSGGPLFPLRSVGTTCPRGTRPMSGGFAVRLAPADPATTQGPAALVFGSRIVGAGWEVTLGRFAPGRTVFRTFAYCSERPTKIRSKTYYLRGTGQLRNLSTPAGPRGTLAISAGFYSPFTFNGQSDVGATIPLEARRLNRRRWIIGAVAISAAPSRSSTYTYCG